MKDFLWGFVPTKEHIEMSGGMLILFYAIIGLLIWFVIQFPIQESEHKNLKIMPCNELKQRILDQDYGWVGQYEAEHEYTWRCEK